MAGKAGHGTFPKGVSGNPAGKRKGVPHKATLVMKDVILHATSVIGAGEELARWYQADDANKVIFWRDIAPKVLPKVIENELQVHDTKVSRVELVFLDPKGQALDVQGNAIEAEAQLIDGPQEG